MLTDRGELVDEDTAAAILTAVEELQAGEAETASASDKAAAVAPNKLVGAWQIRHTIYMTNGETSTAPPVMPTEWIFDGDGSLRIHGGMDIDLEYLYTGSKLIVTGLGPKQDYEINKLTETELEVVAGIVSSDTLTIANTTVLQRKR